MSNIHKYLHLVLDGFNIVEAQDMGFGITEEHYSGIYKVNTNWLANEILYIFFPSQNDEIFLVIPDFCDTKQASYLVDVEYLNKENLVSICFGDDLKFHNKNFHGISKFLMSSIDKNWPELRSISKVCLNKLFKSLSTEQTEYLILHSLFIEKLTEKFNEYVYMQRSKHVVFIHNKCVLNRQLGVYTTFKNILERYGYRKTHVYKNNYILFEQNEKDFDNAVTLLKLEGWNSNVIY